MDYKKNIIDYCGGIGLDTVGFCECRVFEELLPVLQERKMENIQNEFEEKDIANRINPKLLFEEGNTIISIAFPYLYSFEDNGEVYFSKYTQGRDYHKVVMQYLNKVCEYIEGIGGKAYGFVDSNPLPERYIAYLSGIGFIGKNNMLITEKYGSYVFLGEIITDLRLEPNNPQEQKCNACSLCHEVCPTKSINSHGSFPNICLSYLTQKKELEDVWFSKLQGRIFGCDSCQSICPFNKTIEKSAVEEFKPYEYMKSPSLEELVYLNNTSFKDRYKATSCGWRGKNILQRNALINKVIVKKDLNFELNQIKSPYVLDYYHRLLRAFHL